MIEQVKSLQVPARDWCLIDSSRRSRDSENNRLQVLEDVTSVQPNSQAPGLLVVPVTAVKEDAGLQLPWMCPEPFLVPGDFCPRQWGFSAEMWDEILVHASLEGSNQGLRVMPSSMAEADDWAWQETLKRIGKRRNTVKNFLMQKASILVGFSVYSMHGISSYFMMGEL